MKQYVVPILIILVLASVLPMIGCSSTGKSNQFSITDKDIRIGLFWQQVREYRESKRIDQLELDRVFLAGEMTPSLWLDDRSSIIEDVANFPYVLRSRARHNLGFPISLEEWKAYDEEKGITSTMENLEFQMLFDQKGIPSPLLHPKDRLLEDYFLKKPEPRKYFDEDTNNWNSHWYLLVGRRTAIIKALPADLSEEFMAELSKYETPLAMLFQQVAYKYISPYENVPFKVVELYSQGEQELIKEYYQTATPMRREELQRCRTTSGAKLIADFESSCNNCRRNLRLLDPEWDAWLLFWGFTETVLTQKAEQVYLELCQKHTKKP